MVGAKWIIEVSKQAAKDAKILTKSNLKDKAEALKEVLAANPFENPPPYEKLLGLLNIYSRRIDGKHRMVYEVNKEKRIVSVLRMWSHYE